LLQICAYKAASRWTFRNVEPSANWLELRVTLEPATRMLVIYSPGYEEQQT
jgi:hypothetical protein